MSYIRGVVTTEDGNLGLLQSVNYNTSVEEATEKDAKGNTALYENFDPKTEAEHLCFQFLNISAKHVLHLTSKPFLQQKTTINIWILMSKAGYTKAI